MITDVDVRHFHHHYHYHNNNYNQIHYLIASVVIATIIGDGFWLFCMNGFHYDSTAMPELFTHKTFPPALWLQSTITMNIAMIIELIVYILLIFTGTKVVPESYRMFALVSDASRYSSSSSTNINVIISNNKGIIY